MTVDYRLLTDNNRFAQWVHNLNPSNKLLRAWELKGGISAQVTGLEIEQPDGRIQKLILRQHGSVDLARNPNIAADEFNLMGQLKTLGVQVPAPIALDTSCEIFPTPVIAVEFIEGQPEFAPPDLDAFISQIASYLAHLHKLDLTGRDFSFLPQPQQRFADRVLEHPTVLDESFNESYVSEILQALWPIPQTNAPALLHGDFWPGNILWKDEQIAAVIDWEDAGFGDPVADLANTRLEILWAFGSEPMHDFTESYRNQNPLDFSSLPYWELVIGLRPPAQFTSWAANETIANTMRERHHGFVMQALEKIEGN